MNSKLTLKIIASFFISVGFSNLIYLLAWINSGKDRTLYQSGKGYFIQQLDPFPFLENYGFCVLTIICLFLVMCGFLLFAESSQPKKF